MPTDHSDTIYQDRHAVNILNAENVLTLKLNRRRLDSIIITGIDVESRFDIDDPFNLFKLITSLRFISLMELALFSN